MALQIPNVKPIVAQLKNEFKDVAINVNVKINPNSVRQLRSLNTELKTLQASLTSISSSTISLGGLTSSLSTLQKTTKGGATSIRQQATAVQSLGRSAARAGSEMELFGKQSALAIKRFAAFSIATGGILSFLFAIKGGIQEAILFDREMVKLSQVTNTSVAGLKDLSSEITRLSIKFGVSSTELLDISSTLAQAGLSARDTKIALEALAKSSLAPSFDNLKDTTEAVIAVMRQFDIPAKDVEKALGSINAVSNVFAVESKDILAAIRQTGGAFAAASHGVSEGKDALNEFIAVFTSIRQTTRESAETIATGLRTIFTRIERPKTIQYLRDFGIELLDIEGKFVGPYEASKRLSAGLKDLDTRGTTFLGIQEELGGYRQIGKVIPLIKQFAVSQEALKVAQEGSNSLNDNAIVGLKALARQLDQTKEKFLALIRSIVETEGFKNITNVILGLTNSFLGLADSLKPVLPYLVTLGTIKLAFAAKSFGRGFLPEITGANRANSLTGAAGAAGSGGGIGGISSTIIHGVSTKTKIKGNPGDAAAAAQAALQNGVNSQITSQLLAGGAGNFTPSFSQVYGAYRKQGVGAQAAHNYTKDYFFTGNNYSKNVNTKTVPSGYLGNVSSNIKSFATGKYGKAAAVAGIVGSSAIQQSIGDSNPISATIGGGIGGGISGGLTGALVGGGPGAIIGAAVGAFTAAIGAFKETNLKQSLEKLTSSLDQVDRTFEAYAHGEATKSQLNEDTSRALSDSAANTPQASNSTLSNASFLAKSTAFAYLPFTRNSILGKAHQRFIGSAAEESGALEDKNARATVEGNSQIVDRAERFFKHEATKGNLPSAGNLTLGTLRGSNGKDKTVDLANLNDFGKENEASLRAFAYRGPQGSQNAKSIQGVVGQIQDPKVKQQVQHVLEQAYGLKAYDKFRIALNGAGKSAEGAAIKVEILNQTFEKVSAVVQRIIAESEQYNINSENILGRTTGAATVGKLASRADVFSNPSAYHPSEIRNEIKGLGLDPKISKSAEETAVGIRVLSEELPKLLLADRLNPNAETGQKSNQANDPLAGHNAAVEKGISSLEEKFGFQLPPDVKSQLSKKIADQTQQNKQAGGEDINTFIETGLRPIIEGFGKDANKAFESLVKGFEEINEKYSSGIDKLIQAQVQVTEKSITAQQLGAHGRLTLQKFRGQSSSIEDIAAPDTVRIDTLAGFRGAAQNPGQIVGNLNAANERIAKNQAEAAQLRATGTNAADPSIKALIDAVAADKEIQIKSIAALEALTHATGELAGIEQKLAIEQNKRAAGTNTLNSVFGASPRQLRQQAIENQAFKQFQATGKLPNGIFAQQAAQNIQAGAARFHGNITDPQLKAQAEAAHNRQITKALNIPDNLAGNIGENIRAAGAPPGAAAGEIPLNNRAAGVIANQQNAADALTNQARPTGLQANLNAQHTDTSGRLRRGTNNALGGKGFVPNRPDTPNAPVAFPPAQVRPDVQAAPAAEQPVDAVNEAREARRKAASELAAKNAAYYDKARQAQFGPGGYRTDEQKAAAKAAAAERKSARSVRNAAQAAEDAIHDEKTKKEGQARVVARNLVNPSVKFADDPTRQAKSQALRDKYKQIPYNQTDRGKAAAAKKLNATPPANDPFNLKVGDGHRGVFSVPDSFTEGTKSLGIAADKLANIPTKITLETTGTVDVRLTGADGLQEGFKTYIMTMINEQLKKVVPLDARMENQK